MNFPNIATIGVISDTHGLMRPEALEALRGSDLILHAGDVGGPEVLDALRALAPVHAVCGNVDSLPLPEELTIAAGAARLYVTHRLQDVRFDPAARGLAAVITGHSHRPGHYSRDGVLYLNPGSAGPRRFSLPVTVARLRIEGAGVSAAILPLEIATGPR